MSTNIFDLGILFWSEVHILMLHVVRIMPL